MKKILVPCDFSAPAIEAFKFAVNVADRSNGEIYLLNVVELPVLHDSVLMPTLSFEAAFMNDLKENAEKNFRKMKEKWAKEGPRVHAHIEYGATTPTIRQFAEDMKVDLVVMGTHGASGLKEFLIGSNTEKIVRTLPVPVIALKKTLKDVKNIVFPNVLVREQEELTLKVKELQSFFKAKLHLVYINTPALFRRDAETREQMKAFTKRYMLKDYTLNIYNDLTEEDGIANFSNDVKADIVAMGTHGRRGISHLMMGSVTEDVVNHLSCPIWTYKAK